MRASDCQKEELRRQDQDLTFLAPFYCVDRSDSGTPASGKSRLSSSGRAAAAWQAPATAPTGCPKNVRLRGGPRTMHYRMHGPVPARLRASWGKSHARTWQAGRLQREREGGQDPRAPAVGKGLDDAVLLSARLIVVRLR